MEEEVPFTPAPQGRVGVIKGLLKCYHASQIPRDIVCLEYDNEDRKFAKFEFTVDERTTSVANNVYGGVLASLTDGLTSTLLLGKPAHVSTGINISYFRPAPIHSKVVVECEAMLSGNNAKCFEARFMNAEGKLLAKGTHTLLKVQKRDGAKL